MTKRITPKQVKALPLLAGGMSGVQTAKIVGVKASTVSEWLNHCPLFIAELERLREWSTRQALGQLQGTLTTAVSELQRIMTKSKTDALRLRAATFVIESVGLPNVGIDSEIELHDSNELAKVLEALNGLGCSSAAK
jgi:hypothetical protein